MIPSAHIPSSQELGLDESNFDKTFKNFSAKPLAAASLGQVHTALYKGKKVAIKVQRAKLKEVRESEERGGVRSEVRSEVTCVFQAQRQTAPLAALRSPPPHPSSLT